MSFTKILSQFKRLSLSTTLVPTFRSFTTNQALFFKPTPCLMAEPLKKKRKLDPAIIRAREDRRKKRLEKQIRRLEKNARQLKPIVECEVPLTLLDQKLERQRGIVHTPEVLEMRALLEKKWANFKRKQLLDDLQAIDQLVFHQQKALDHLRNESEELYQEAIQIDFHMVPFTSQGPAETPPIEGYDVPDGDYQDVSKKW